MLLPACPLPPAALLGRARPPSHLQFSPYTGNAKSAREFIARISSRKAQVRAGECASASSWGGPRFRWLSPALAVACLTAQLPGACPASRTRMPVILPVLLSPLLPQESNPDCKVETRVRCVGGGTACHCCASRVCLHSMLP